MKKQLIILLFIVFSFTLGYALFDDYEPSPRVRALGGSFCTLAGDANGVFYNPAGIALSQRNVEIGYTKLFGHDFQKLKTLSASYPLPKKYGVIGFGVQSFDVEYKDVTLLSEKIFALSHSIKLLDDVHSQIYFGYVANLYMAEIETFDEGSTFGLNLGAMAVLHQRTRIGFSVHNLNNPKMGADNSFDLPQKISTGISYVPYQGVLTIIELQKTMNNAVEDTEFHAGVEVEVAKPLTLRFGTRNKPAKYSMGAKIQHMGLELNYAFDTHELDNTHHISVGYRF